ncbi:hypothetical protein Tco_0079536 [Tanacetum coccineum]
MTESSSPDITPNEEPGTLNRPESPNLFLPASLVEFTFDEITFTTNNEVDYAKIIWDDLIHKLNKKTRKKIVPYPRFISFLLEHMAHEYENKELTINPTQVFSVHNWILKPNQPKEPPFTDHMKAICNLDVHVDSKAPKYSSPMEEKETKSSSAMDTSPSHHSPPTPVVGEMHKEAQQAAGEPTSLGATGKEGAYPQLSSDFTAEADPGLSVPQIAYLHKHSYLKKELEHQKAAAEAEAASLKAKPSYPDINPHTTLLILLGDLQEIHQNKETSTSTSLQSQSQAIAELKNINVNPFKQSLLKKVTNTLNRIATLVENASGATTTSVPLADKATASPAEGRKVLYEKYCEKMKKKRQSSKIINCDVLTKKGPISLKVVQACPDRKEKGWKTIYELIKKRMEFLEQNEKELHIDFNKSIQEQDPLDELNDIANKKRKRIGDSTYHSRSSKKHKSSSST